MLALALLALVTAIAAQIVALIVWRSRPTYDATSAGARPEDVLGLRQEVASLAAESKTSLRHVAMVRYDAFGDMGGQLSWSLALLDDSGVGVVLTSIHGRSDARSYAKSVTGWKAEAQLSPEETEAIAAARPKH